MHRELIKNKNLNVFVGKWKTTGEIFKSPFGSSGIIKGTDSYRWHTGKDFLIHSVDVKMAKQKIKNTEVISFDPKKKAFAMYAFDKGNVTGTQHGKLIGNRWTVIGEKIRFVGSFDRNRKILIGKWQYKSQKSGWKIWINLKLTKVSNG